MGIEQLDKIPLVQLAEIAQKGYAAEGANHEQISSIMHQALGRYLKVLGNTHRLPEEIDRTDFYQKQKQIIHEVRLRLPAKIGEALEETLGQLEAEIESRRPRTGQSSNSSILFDDASSNGRRKNRIG